MDLKDLDRLVEKYAHEGFQQIRVKAGDLEIEVQRPSAPVKPVSSEPTAPTSKLTTIKSPMVGVVHLADELTVGQPVAAGQELAQIESMKLFNPLKSPVAGTVAAILVTDNAAVEYDQPLIELRKDR
ncbi:acetyl-CoA carboxylase biotin carboxyl carrier protein [Lactiplantibacillus plajomi]|uniref:Acetyl-CoA carboxylase biotin carboxyl carrier protein n=1 Tax=Lactiplantibacillus plajomi TaxID=1457217 RepID=A0ABV6K1F2_9LACO|nr:acetyl-CoA carboxylase biotin carboxyl carrier protein subunit [Lactiplantibacillus plajomi]